MEALGLAGGANVGQAAKDAARQAADELFDLVDADGSVGAHPHMCHASMRSHDRSDSHPPCPYPVPTLSLI